VTRNVSLRSTSYATLSHCWGETMPIRLLKSNFEQYTECIPLELLPLTFQDAIAITNGLGIPYLWIDSLCIIQDSGEDWICEAPKMNSIYRGSALNIAASDASNSQEGCFGKRDSLNDQESCMIFLDNEGTRPDLLRVQFGDTRQATNHTIISTRGWVLQEQLLSHRMVSCMGSEMHWECQASYQTECGVHFRQTESDMRSMTRLHQQSAQAPQDTVWRRWMERYSKRFFTFWKDKLPAISGITQHYQDITGDEPILGLWKSSLLQDLLWVRLSPVSARALKELRKINLPSWSFLSCPAEIAFDLWLITLRTNGEDPLVTVEDYTKVIDCSVEWSGQPFISRVKQANLILEGPKIEILIKPVLDEHMSNPPYLHVEFARTLSDRNVLPQCQGQFDIGNDELSAIYTALLLRTRQHQQTKMWREIFLILQPTLTGSGESKFKRVGIACFMSSQAVFDTCGRQKVVFV
jgi:hypothetical protein